MAMDIDSQRMGEAMGFMVLLGSCCLVTALAWQGQRSKIITTDREGLPAHKYSVKVIKNDVGDIFDCININRQPAFDHPLLKNHTIQMRPTFLPEGIFEEATLSAMSPLKNETCPIGTIPIMRHHKENTRASKPVFSFIMEHDVLNFTYDGVYAFAEVQLIPGEYYGSIADLNVYPLPKVSAKQSSSSAIWLINEGNGIDPREQNSILAGWTVNPSLYGDTNTRLFIYWTADGFQKTGCYNLLCPGFVQVASDTELGSIISPLSEYGGPQYIFRILVFKDPNTENWWLVIGNYNKIVGYWPKSLFSTLAGHANVVHWGGWIYTPLNEKSPPMGSGYFEYDPLHWKVCFFDKVKVVDKDNRYIDSFGDKKIIYHADECYNVGPFVGNFFNFGGFGGCVYGSSN